MQIGATCCRLVHVSYNSVHIGAVWCSLVKLGADCSSFVHAGAD